MGWSQKSYDLFPWNIHSIDDYSTFWKANSKLQSTDLSSLKKIPIRLFQFKQLTCTQVPVSPLDEKGSLLMCYLFSFKYTGSPRSLGNVLIEILPSLESSINEGKVGIIIQGIQPTLDTPITWLAENLSHPDNFLYIIIKLA